MSESAMFSDGEESFGQAEFHHEAVQGPGCKLRVLNTHDIARNSIVVFHAGTGVQLIHIGKQEIRHRY